jgi:hypothetical protein
LVEDKSTSLPVLEPDALPAAWQAQVPVLCAAGRGPLDEAVAAMLAQLLQKHGLNARVESADAIAGPNMLRLETAGVALICLSYLDNSSAAHMRYAVRRLRRRLPQVGMLPGCWMSDADTASIRDLVRADAAVTTLQDAAAYAVRAACGGASTPSAERASLPIATLAPTSKNAA